MVFNDYQSLFRKLGIESLTHYSRDDIRVEYRESVVTWYLEAIEYQEINMYTEFQRSSGAWDNLKKSRFIESLLMHLPITPIFLAQNEDYEYDIIDGLQRLNTINEYVREKSFFLEGMEFYPELNGLKYDELPPIACRHLQNSRIPVSVLLPGADEIIKVKIFHRVNTSGSTLTAQEIRSSLYFSSYFYRKLMEVTKKTLIDKLNVSDKKKLAQELVLNVISLSVFGLDNFKGEKSLSDFLDESMRVLSSLPDDEINTIFERFEISFFHCLDVFGNDNPFVNKKNKFTKSIFLSVMMIFFKGEFLGLKNKKYYYERIHAPDFLKLTTSGSSKYNAIKRRDEILKEVL